MGKNSYYEHFAVTGNAAALAVIHTVYGVFISYIFYYIFDEFDESWESKSKFYQVSDVIIEIMLISVFGYWASETTLMLSPIFPTSKAKEIAVDSWVSGIFFVIALFLFLDSLNEKLKFLQNYYFETFFSSWFPQYGSIIDFSLSYDPITEEDKKKTRKTEEN